MSMIRLKDYIKQETEYILSECVYVENLAEDFEMDEDSMYDLIEGIEEDVAEAINSNEYYMTTINEWIADEIRDAIKSKLKNK